MRLKVAVGAVVRFELGQSREVMLAPLCDKREGYGFNQKVMERMD